MIAKSQRRNITPMLGKRMDKEYQDVYLSTIKKKLVYHVLLKVCYSKNKNKWIRTIKGFNSKRNFLPYVVPLKKTKKHWENIHAKTSKILKINEMNEIGNYAFKDSTEQLRKNLT